MNSMENYREFFDNAGDAMYVHDLSGKYTIVNRAAEQLSGYSRDEILKLNIYDVVPRIYARQIDEKLKKTLLEHAAAVCEIDLITKDGRSVPVEVNCSLIYDEGVPVGVHGIARDLTLRQRAEEARRKQTEEALLASQTQLQQSQKLEAIGQLAGGLAHDFNNLLTAILGYCQLSLLQLDPEHPAARDIEHIQKAAERAALLIRQLLAFSRKQIREPKVLDLNYSVSDMFEMLRPLIRENIQLVVSLADDLGRVKADPGQIEQIIVNLVVNARDAMPTGGQLTIETANVQLDDEHARKYPPTQPGPYVLLTISDTGTGMDSETQARVFEPFFTTKKPGEGTGLGLSNVYGIVKQSGGYIWVESELGRGTAFRVYLPRVNAPLTPVWRARAGAASSKCWETVLLVEDEPELRGIVREILESAGYRILEPNDIDEAIRTSKEYGEKIHLVLADMVMPKMRGHEFADYVRSLHPGTRVLFMSGYTNDVSLKDTVQDSNASFIQKPFSPSELLKKLREVLDSKEIDGKADQ